MRLRCPQRRRRRSRLNGSRLLKALAGPTQPRPALGQLDLAAILLWPCKFFSSSFGESQPAALVVNLTATTTWRDFNRQAPPARPRHRLVRPRSSDFILSLLLPFHFIIARRDLNNGDNKPPPGAAQRSSSGSVGHQRGRVVSIGRFLLAWRANQQPPAFYFYYHHLDAQRELSRWGSGRVILNLSSCRRRDGLLLALLTRFAVLPLEWFRVGRRGRVGP